MRIRYLPAVIRDLDGIAAYIRQENPSAAADVTRQIREFIDLLMVAPDVGRSLGGTLRVSPIPRLPYLVYYRRLPTELRILRIRHGRGRPIAIT